MHSRASQQYLDVLRNRDRRNTLADLERVVHDLPQGAEKNEGFRSDVNFSVLTGDSDEGELVERVGASLGRARAAAVV